MQTSRESALTRGPEVQRLFYNPWTMALVALVLRLAVMAFTYTDQLDPARNHFAFGFETGRIARSIASGQGFSSPYPEPTGPTALISPVYPYMLAGIFQLFGIYTAASALAILSLNNLFSALTCLPAFYIARNTFGPDVARWTGWAWAFFPYSVVLGNRWIWETNFTTLLLSLLLLVTLRLEQSGKLRAWLGCGLLWALAALTSPAVLSVLPFLWAWVWYRQRRRGERCGHRVIGAALVLLACLTPWLLRNFRLLGQVALRSNFALEFLVGNNEDTSKPASDTLLPADNPVEMEKIRRLGEPAYMAEKQREAWEFVARHPGRFAWLTVRRFIYVWTGIWDLHPKWGLDESGAPNIIFYTGITILALVGFRRGLRNHEQYITPLVIPLAVFPLVYYITHPDIRYRHPIDPLIVILAVYGATGHWWRGREGSRADREVPATP
jgi:4-amino-4-deoxy-L-arabinose transferase-like glycosyltransferase